MAYVIALTYRATGFPCPLAAKQGNNVCEFDLHSSRSSLGCDAKVTSNQCPSNRPWDLFPGTLPYKPVDRPPRQVNIVDFPARYV